MQLIHLSKGLDYWVVYYTRYVTHKRLRLLLSSSVYSVISYGAVKVVRRRYIYTSKSLLVSDLLISEYSMGLWYITVCNRSFQTRSIYGSLVNHVQWEKCLGGHFVIFVFTIHPDLRNQIPTIFVYLQYDGTLFHDLL